MKLEALPWLILFLPLLAAGIIALFTLRNKAVSATLSIGAIVTGFVLTLAVIKFGGWEARELSVNWLSIGSLTVDFGLKLDALSLMMLLIVTGVGSAIHIYSYGYMHDDPGFSRFFACLSLFTFSMLGIVLSNNFLQMFIFWELVGVSSYLLIGFWFEKASAADAAKKAFITNRLGDFGFILGILMVWAMFGSLSFDGMKPGLASFMAEHSGPTPLFFLAGLLIFCGAVGKSAQFPLHVWLPDAMEGPTPVSALIHAATMVAAGVFMLCRVFFLLEPSGALTVIAWIGGFTALLAALIAVQQNDIKRILAYSTLSQLGYMVMAVGLHSPESGMFHLTTHAFFKALLFLGAGSVIHAMHHEQDIWKMGALRKKMPVTFWTFMVGTIALAGVWPLSGFFSKDAILAAAHEHSIPLFILGVFVALLTTFYMFRLVFVAFFGAAKSHGVDHAHESPGVMIWPLRILAILSIVGGVIGIESLFAGMFKPEGEHPHGLVAQLIYPFQHAPVAAFSGLAVFAIGLFAAWKLYANAKEDPLPAKLGALSKAMQNRFYFDEIYEATFIRAHDAIAAVADWIDRWIVEGFCIGLVRGGTDLTGRALRLVQTGNLQTYAFLFVLGVAVVLWFVLGK
ncbi:MAG TPA: NADH-quinone oxidoreductase subunit L [Verrucomicrobiota bacterium]|nr:NADH-quinone oxidoreductase subunit L [Verrucomicrobiota bacterium]